MGSRVCGGLSYTPGVAQYDRSAGCVMCELWAMSAAVLGEGYPVGVSISSSVCIQIDIYASSWRFPAYVHGRAATVQETK